VTIHRSDALRFAERLQPGAYDVAFADSPYAVTKRRSSSNCTDQSLRTTVLDRALSDFDRCRG